MSASVVVQIIGTRVACAGGVKETWRELAAWAAGQLIARFGEAVQVRYFDLLEANCPPLPPGAQLPALEPTWVILTLIYMNNIAILSGRVKHNVYRFK